MISIFSLKNSLSSLGIETKLSDRMSAALNIWDGLYREKSSLSLASAIAAEIARLVTIEFRSEITGSKRAEYLEEHPKSGYLTEIINLTTFPDYIDHFPKGAISRKIAVMKYLPSKKLGAYPFVAITREEYSVFVDNASEMIIQKIMSHNWGIC